MDFLKPQVGKARKPKFELHLKIYDLNNVPLVTGHSFVKWHLTHSMHAEHRGRTGKCPIANHRVDYSFCTLMASIRISVDRNNNLAECPIELEVVQEFAGTEKMTLGFVRLNLSEYIEESEAFTKDVTSPGRKRSNSVGVSPAGSGRDLDVVEDGIVRRYLMQDSKVNSTLKIGILMIQVDGERSYIAPPLKTAPVFGGIGGIMGESIEDEVGPVPSISKPRDAAELQDLYRRTLAASWSRQTHELPADECIEDIFNGGNGWKTKLDSGSPDTDEEDEDADDSDFRDGTLRPRDVRRIGILHHNQNNLQPNHTPNNAHPPQPSAPARSHRRTPSNSSDKSVSTVTVTPHGHHPGRKNVRIHELDHSRSLASLTSSMTLDSDALHDTGLKRSREVPEFDIRNDLVAWRLPGSVGLDM
ncbi:N-terminal C2 in EEIG1 and EHBP1 proteins-domain-containing protein [Ilyonectria robusta]|uniref:N-terminal C2 in EEIG1 and EHBP1 proteins-domain-containing protein n=1 Tax=Ilyonectria robusta TaxID=1079257 RepID=UPI001E8CEA42|nr:N-terminal C2 in EEIG1 and EHBP1 proteins-domain-containing protein [Ilyonectria robusta]KAH8676970.1 N-terminal C2 in EEIG1 and EHBP1 proteins-domain-containing protein [Ilyonectria robusta]